MAVAYRRPPPAFIRGASTTVFTTRSSALLATRSKTAPYMSSRSLTKNRGASECDRVRHLNKAAFRGFNVVCWRNSRTSLLQGSLLHLVPRFAGDDERKT